MVVVVDYSKDYKDFTAEELVEIGLEGDRIILENKKIQRFERIKRVAVFADLAKQGHNGKLVKIVYCGLQLSATPRLKTALHDLWHKSQYGRNWESQVLKLFPELSKYTLTDIWNTVAKASDLYDKREILKDYTDLVIHTVRQHDNPAVKSTESIEVIIEGITSMYYPELLDKDSIYFHG